MSLTRRKTLAILGGGTIFAATAASAGFLTTRTPAKALAPWETAGGYADPRKNALSYAVLAPNPHNRQPWIVDLNTEDQVVLYRDLDRDLPHTDPFSRQLTIGLGCFLELMQIAAAEDGHAVEIDLYPEGENGPVAVARFERGGAPDPLFAQVLRRRSCKEPFADTSLTTSETATLSRYAELVTDPDKVEQLRQLTLDGWMTEMQTPRTLKESVDLMRLGKAEINATPDGIDLGGPFLESLMMAGLLTRESLLDPKSTSFKEGDRSYREMLLATPAYAVITTPRNSRGDQITAGRQWLRLNLKTTELGLALHPVSQVLQEFEEMRGPYRKAHELLAGPGETVQMLGRIGTGPKVPPSPRWPLESRLRNE